jgi:predicted Fe-S protein YdhL (DUF1289 family)
MSHQLSGNPDTPCIGVCSTLFDDTCKGCGRTAQEVIDWISLQPEQKAAIWARIVEEGTAIRFRMK